jgi:hypothetical protein
MCILGICSRACGDARSGFFSQFGRVTRVRLSRNKRSTRSKGYAFVEFANKDVAAIAAEAMDGYMMFRQKLVVSVMPAAEVHAQLFKGAQAGCGSQLLAASRREIVWVRPECSRTDSATGCSIMQVTMTR